MYSPALVFLPYHRPKDVIDLRRRIYPHHPRSTRPGAAAWLAGGALEVPGSSPAAREEEVGAAAVSWRGLCRRCWRRRRTATRTSASRRAVAALSIRRVRYRTHAAVREVVRPCKFYRTNSHRRTHSPRKHQQRRLDAKPHIQEAILRFSLTHPHFLKPCKNRLRQPSSGPTASPECTCPLDQMIDESAATMLIDAARHPPAACPCAARLLQDPRTAENTLQLGGLTGLFWPVPHQD